MGVVRTNDLIGYEGYRSSDVDLEADRYVAIAYNDIRYEAQHVMNEVTKYMDAAAKGIQTFSPFSPGAPVLKPELEKTHSIYSAMEIPPLPKDLFATIDTGNTPAPSTVKEIDTYAVGNVPAYTGDVYTPYFPPAPELTNVEDPGEFSTGVSVTLPDPLLLDEPVSHNITPIFIPPIPKLNVPIWDTATPNFSHTKPPIGQFNFTEVPYESSLLEQTDSLIQQMEDGGVGIPDFIWNTIWDKSSDQITKAGDKQIDDINKEWASKGFSLPQGAQAGQILEVRQNIIEEQSKSSRELAITYAQDEVKNLQFAVQQGIALENIKGQWYQAELERAFKTAENVLGAIYKNFEADMAFNNLVLQQYSTEAEVYKSLITAETIRLESVKTEIQAQELVIKSDNLMLQKYDADIKALSLKIEEYNASVAAANSAYEGLKAEVQVYGEEIKAYVARIDAQTQKTNVYKETVAAEGIKVNAYETSVKAYGEEVRAFAAKVDANSTNTQTQVSIEELKISTYDSQIKGYQAELAAKSEVQNANVEWYKAYIGAHNALMEEGKTATNTILESDKNRISFSKLENDGAVAASELASRASEASAKVIVDTNTQLADINTGLLGSMYSSINIGANVSESISGSVSASNSVSYFGGNL